MIEITWDAWEAPEWWGNYVNHIRETEGLTDEMILEDLKSWGATFTEPVLCRVSGVWVQEARVTFESERHYTIFLLKWA